MARMTVKGFDEMAAALSKLANQDEIEGICKRGVFDAAGIVADATRSAIASLPTGNATLHRVRAAQKRGQLDGLGIAAMTNEGGVINPHVGMDGYNQHKAAGFPNGQPNMMIARAVESGTSYGFPAMHPFSRAYRAAKGAAEKAMKSTVEKEIEDRAHAAGL